MHIGPSISIFFFFLVTRYVYEVNVFGLSITSVENNVVFIFLCRSIFFNLFIFSDERTSRVKSLSCLLVLVKANTLYDSAFVPLPKITLNHPPCEGIDSFGPSIQYKRRGENNG